jgi:hypothetical protein
LDKGEDECPYSRTRSFGGIDWARGFQNDSLSHLFFSCIFAKIVWRNSFWPVDSLAWSHLSMVNLIKCILNPSVSLGLPPKDTHLFQIFAAVFCDLFWFSKNKVAHDGVIPNVLVLVESIKKIDLEHIDAWESFIQIVIEKWSPTEKGSFKINFDTTIREHSFFSQAVVCRDSNGIIVKVVS